MVWGFRSIAALSGVVAFSAAAAAAPCLNPNALGVSRVLTVDPRAMPLVGSHDYGATLPLAPGEVVLTFDDGPRPPYTTQVLAALANECVHATFFMVGQQASAYSATARQVRAAGHTVGTHSQNHPLHRMPINRAKYEIDTGIASVTAALGSPQLLAPFFRFPGLYRSNDAENYLARRGIMVWSVDVDSDDWKRGDASAMLDRTMAQLTARRGGILLMHDVKPNTARALPVLLARLKARGFRIVHVVPRGSSPSPELMASARRQRREQVATAPRMFRVSHRVNRYRETTRLVVEARNDPALNSFDMAFAPRARGR